MSKNLTLACPPVGGDRIAIMKESIVRWLATPSLADLAVLFGGNVPDGAGLKELSKWYLALSDAWDFRDRQKQAFDSKVGEGARWLLSSDELTDEQKKKTLVAATDLGLRGNDGADREDFDYVWVLGGAKLSCLLRGRLAARTVQTAKSKPKAIVLLGSARPIGDAERKATNTYAPDAETEFDLFAAAAQKEFDAGDTFEEERHNDAENPNSSWVVRKYGVNGADLFVIAAPSSEPAKRRANSADTYEFFFDKFRASEGSSILVTTSQIYVPYQHLEAVRTVAIPHNVYLDTIGFVPEWGGELQGMNEPSNYLQEIRSTIQAIDRFLTQYS
jgi:hypothetical protein